MTVICGIDPGQKGGIAFIDTKEDKITALPLPEIKDLVDLLYCNSPRIVYLEKAQTMPRQGISSAFNYGCHFGQIQGILYSFAMRFVLVPPSVWTRSLHVGCTGTDAKKKSLQAVRRLFPTVELLASSKCRVPHDGMVDALLICEYGRRTHVA